MKWPVTAALLALGMGASGEPPNRVLVGVLEDTRSTAGVAEHRIRVAFRADGSGGWKGLTDGLPLTFPDGFDPPKYEAAEATLRRELPTETRWAVCSDGRTLGTLESVLPPTWGYSKLRGTHVVRPRQDVPSVGVASEDFSGWPGNPVHRPLALSSTGHCRDPSGWRPIALTQAELRKLLPKLRAAVNARGALWRDESVDLNGIPTINKVFRDRRSNLIVTLSTNDSEKATFYVPKSGTARHLGNWLSLIDAGDYDGDGRSELLFMFQREDFDGYLMFYDEASRYASFGWIYH